MSKAVPYDESEWKKRKASARFFLLLGAFLLTVFGVIPSLLGVDLEGIAIKAVTGGLALSGAVLLLLGFVKFCLIPGSSKPKPIYCVCPSCRARLESEPEAAGEVDTCPHCKLDFRVPG